MGMHTQNLYLCKTMYAASKEVQCADENWGSTGSE